MRRRLPRRWRITIRAVAVVLVGLVALTARLFIWPEQGMPSHVDAIVMMNGSGDRLDTALESRLGARRPRAGDLPRVAVLGTWQHLRAEDPRVTVICFDPSPATTQGEAEFAGRLARRYHWRSIALVTTTPQDTRARLRLDVASAGRCTW